jgi:hypothetical protein
MTITPLPKILPDDLRAIETLIRERFIYTQKIDDEIKVKREEKDVIRKEIAQLQKVGKKLLMIVTREKKVEPGEQS